MATFAAQGNAPWSTDNNYGAAVKKPPKFVNAFNQNTTKVAGRIPATYNAAKTNFASPNPGANTPGANTMVQQRTAANPNGVAGQQSAVKNHISRQEQQVVNPQAQQETAETYTDGLSGISQMGQAATAGVQDQIRVQQEEQAKAAAANAAANAANSGGGGSYGEFSDGAGGISGFAGLDSQQIGYANQIIKTGLSRGLGAGDIQTALMTAMAESSFRNVNYGDQAGPDSRGLFQQRSSQGWGTTAQTMDPNYSINKFYDALGSAPKGANLWNNAQAVQRSAYSDGSNYQKHAGMAAGLWDTYNRDGGISTAPVTGSNGSASWINANIGKYHDYDKAYGAQCVDLYAFYTSGFAGGTPYGVGYAQELWGNHDSKAYVKIAGNQRPQMGDVAIWSNGMNGMGGHVAIVSQDNGNGTIRTLSANSTAAGSNGNTVMINLSKGSLLGYLRPRKLM